MIETANGAFTYGEFAVIVFMTVLFSYGYIWLFHKRWLVDTDTED